MTSLFSHFTYSAYMNSARNADRTTADRARRVVSPGSGCAHLFTPKLHCCKGVYMALVAVVALGALAVGSFFLCAIFGSEHDVVDEGDF